jgi:hypothetical protein
MNTHLLASLILIAFGFLVKLFPNLIAGYNTLPADKKKNVDVDGLSTLMRMRHAWTLLFPVDRT